MTTSFKILFGFLCALLPQFLLAQSPDLEKMKQWAYHLEMSRHFTEADLQKIADLKATCFVVSHTHWDKEWGSSFEQHHIPLVKLMDNVIEILENDPDYPVFMLDGQSSLVEDYLETRPEMRDRLTKLVQTNRLQVGPWYTQPDMLVSSGEEIVRNLLLGIQTAEKVGKSMKFGYTADNFGFCAQLPQIYRGFGIDRAAFYRGPDPASEIYKTIFKWKGLDGRAITVAYMLGPAGYLIFTWPYPVPEMPESYLIKSLGFILPHAVTNKILLPAGSDAEEADPNLPRTLKKLEQSFPNLKFKIATLDEYLDAALADNPVLPEHQGNLRSQSHSCAGAISSRMYLKQANATAYTNLEHFAEPYNAFAWLLTGRRYPASSLEHAWKELSENLSHDDMGGASYDGAYHLVNSRYYEANRLAETLAFRGMKTIVERIKTPDKSNLLKKPVVVFNPLNWARSGVVEFWLPVDQFSGGIRNPFKEQGFTSFKVQTLDGKDLPSVVTPETQIPDAKGMLRTRFLAPDIPACGYQTFLLVATKNPLHENRPKPTRMVENAKVRLTFAGDGRFDLLDKETGILYPGLHFFEDQHAPGNPWMFSPQGPVFSTIGLPAKIELIEENELHQTVRVTHDWQVPARKPGVEMTALKITSFITLTSSSKQISIYTEVENNACDHRLRVAFPVPVSCEKFTVGEQFGVQNHPVYDPANPPKGAWAQEYHPHLDWLDVSDDFGLALFDRGTPSVSVYRTENGSKILLTLIRATESHGGDIRPAITTERFSSEPQNLGAQMQGKYGFHYHIYPHEGNWETARVYQHAGNANVRLWPETLWRQDFPKWQAGPYGFQEIIQWPAGDLPTQGSWISVTPDGAQLSAIKKAETGNALIVRLFNTTPRATKFQLILAHAVKSVTAVNLLEQVASGLAEIHWKTAGKNQTQVQFELKPFEIFTLRFEVDTPAEKPWFHTKY